MAGKTENQLSLIRATESAGSVAIAGLDKNAGKTTVLNALVHAWQDMPRRIILTSIGYDGELKDLLHGHAKPQVYMFPGMGVVTAASFLSTATIDPEIRAVFSGDSVFGPPVLAKANHAGFVVLSGPSALALLVEIKAYIRSEWPKSLFIIDGAFGRRTNASAAYADRVIFCLSGAGVTPAELAAAFAHRQALLTIPLAAETLQRKLTGVLKRAETALISLDGKAGGQNALYVRGALTDSVLLHWLANGLKPADLVVAEDRANVFLTKTAWRQLEKNAIELQALNGADLALVAFNPRGVREAAPYLLALKKIARVPVIMLDTLPAIGKAI